MEYDSLIENRLQLLNLFEKKFIKEDTIIFSNMIDGLTQTNYYIIPFINLFIKDKHLVRKFVFDKIRTKELNEEVSKSSEVFFFSFDPIYDVDYLFHFDFNSSVIKQIIYRKNGDVIYFNNYNENFDERILLYSKIISKSKNTEVPKLNMWKSIRLFHLTDFHNLQSILEKGLLSHSIVHNLKVSQIDISNKSVNNRRAFIHDKVPLYFNPLNPMNSVLRNNNNLIILEFDRRILLLNGICFTDGNAASDGTHFYTSITDLKKLDWECINGKYWKDYFDGKRKRCAEVLVPYKIDPNMIISIHCKSKSMLEKVNKITTQNRAIEIFLNKNLFFEND
jgi:hypothetical protein